MRQADSGGAWGAPRWRGGDRNGRQPPVFNAPPVVLQLIVVIVAASAIVWLLPARLEQSAQIALSLVPLRFWAGGPGPGEWLQAFGPLLSHMFLHWDVTHLAFNCVWLLALGTPVARRFGAGLGLGRGAPEALFLAFFVAGGIAGGAADLLLNPSELTLSLGASGGVMAFLGAVVRFAFAPSRSGRLAPIFDRRILAASAVIVALNVYFGLFGGGLFGGGEVDVGWQAHLGGYAFGLLALPLFERAAPSL